MGNFELTWIIFYASIWYEIFFFRMAISKNQKTIISYEESLKITFCTAFLLLSCSFGSSRQLEWLVSDSNLHKVQVGITQIAIHLDAGNPWHAYQGMENILG